MATQPGFAEYREEWLRDVLAGEPTTSELGHRFARKLITQWLDVDEATDEIVYCDGAGDGGIDIAYLHRPDVYENGNGDTPNEGDVWYLVQSKYGSAFQGTNTLLEESQKVISTLDGQRQNLSSLAQGLVQRLTIFRQQAGELDRLLLVFATEQPLTNDQQQILDDIRVVGRHRLGPIFDVEAVSIATIHQRVLDEPDAGINRIEIPLKANLVASGQDLLVGGISLLHLYNFLKAYRSATGDLDQLYEKNVRRFLGSRGRVNKAMQTTLKNTPEQFGLYNNGITIVVEDFQETEEGLRLVEPYVVNGCQTTRTIWEVFHQRLEAGGTGMSLEQQNWQNKAKQGVVVTKIVKVGSKGDELLQSITRFTNSQNAVREKDFLALTSDFRSMARQMGDLYNVFLETQRGGWESQSAYQRQHPNGKQFSQHANAFDLFKVYGAGWLGEPGVAFGRNAAFLPNGSVFKRIFDDQSGDNSFTVENFYAAYSVQKSADNFGFGRRADKPSRFQTRFLFYMVALDLLRGVMALADLPTSTQSLTNALIKLYQSEDFRAINTLMDVAIEVVDEYLSPGSDLSVFREPAYQNIFNNNLNGYLKAEQLGKSDEISLNLRNLLSITKRTLSRGTPAPRDLILAIISN